MSSQYRVPLPQPGAFDPAVLDYLSRVAAVIQRALDDISIAAEVSVEVSNVTPVTSFDASAATLADTRNLLGQIYGALKARGSMT